MIVDLCLSLGIDPHQTSIKPTPLLVEKRSNILIEIEDKKICQMARKNEDKLFSER